ncbi:hypothetical protein INR49_027111 [Caranx melampygus]|nr:hypothetical protein INR49_027111 [Caranx melampygus]
MRIGVLCVSDRTRSSPSLIISHETRKENADEWGDMRSQGEGRGYWRIRIKTRQPETGSDPAYSGKLEHGSYFCLSLYLCKITTLSLKDWPKSSQTEHVSSSRVFQPQTPSVLAEAGRGGAGDGQKDQEAGPSLEEKDVGVNQRQAARQLWQERWLVQQLHQLQLMLLMATVSLKQASLHPVPCSLPWAGLVPAQPSTPTEAHPPRPKEALPPRVRTNKIVFCDEESVVRFDVIDVLGKEKRFASMSYVEHYICYSNNVPVPVETLQTSSWTIFIGTTH